MNITKITFCFLQNVEIASFTIFACIYRYVLENWTLLTHLYSKRFFPFFFSLIPSNHLISSGGHNFVTPAANFCDLLEGSFHEISKFFKNKLSFKYFYLLMLFGAKKRLIWHFLKISILLDFVTKLILDTPKNVLENTNKEAS
jgi:hypothetical protein